MRKEWSTLDINEKAIYIRKFFEGTTEESLSKADRKAFLEARGAPARPGTAFGAFMSEHLPDFKHLSAQERMKSIADLWSKLSPLTKERYVREANVEMELYQQKWKKFVKSLSKEELKWIEPPKPGSSKRKKDAEGNDTADKQDNHGTEKVKKLKTEPNLIPEPQKPPENVVAYYAEKKYDGDRKEAKKKWKTLKDSKKAKYERQLEEIQNTYFEELKTYLKSLSTEEVKEYKKRTKKVVKEEVESD